MKISTSFGQLAIAVLSLSSVSPIWAWSLPGLDAIVVRAETKTTSGNAPANTGDSNNANTFNLNTGSTAGPTGTGTGDGKKTTSTGTGKGATTQTGDSDKSSKNSTASHTTFNAQDPAGGIVMITPAATAAQQLQLYKIGDFITWGWNYTNLQATPTAIDILASCSFATRTFTLTQNMTFQSPGSYTWDTGAYQSNNIASPLLTEEYTLIVYDAESSISATPEAGYLDTFDSFTFGLYATQTYTPLADGWTCATCSGAMSDMEKRALGFAVTMSIITVLSFTWFVTGMRLTI